MKQTSQILEKNKYPLPFVIFCIAFSPCILFFWILKYFFKVDFSIFFYRIAPFIQVALIALFILLLLSCTSTRPTTWQGEEARLEDWNTIRLTAAVIQLQNDNIQLKKDNAELKAMARPVDTTQWMMSDSVLRLRPNQTFDTGHFMAVYVGRFDTTRGGGHGPDTLIHAPN